MHINVATYTSDDEELEAIFDVYPIGDSLQADFVEAFIAPFVSGASNHAITREQLVAWGLYTELYEDALNSFDWSGHIEQEELAKADLADLMNDCERNDCL